MHPKWGNTLSVFFVIISARFQVEALQQDINVQSLEPVPVDKVVYGANETDIRLPNNIVPLHYDLELQPYSNQDNSTFNGRTKIWLHVVSTTLDIILHASQISMKLMKLSCNDKRPLPKIAKFTKIPQNDLFIIHLEDELEAGRYCILYTEYSGKFRDDLLGFFRSFYLDAEGQQRWLVATKFEPTYARRAYPCFDEPHLKATFNISLIRPKGMHSLSNMPIFKTEEVGDGWYIDHFQKTPPMSTYLATFIVSDFVGIGTEKYNIWSRGEILPEITSALVASENLLKHLEEFFGVKYAFPKLGSVAMPEYPTGATENWGLISYQEQFLRYDPNVYDSGREKDVLGFLAHEQTHQWLGNLITVNWWDELWLQEGFATYFGYHMVNKVKPNWNMDEIFVIEFMQLVMDFETVYGSKPIKRKVVRTREIKDMFDLVNYAKAAAVVRMARFFLGEETFRLGLTDFISNHKFKSVTQNDLFDSWSKFLAESSSIDVKKVIEPWLLQDGYPIVTVTRDYQNRIVTLKQLPFPSVLNTKANHTWSIPITYMHSKNENNTSIVWFHEKTGELTELRGIEDWILLNIRQIGYFRIRYDSKNWQLLNEQLLKDHKKIPTLSRAQLLDDQFDFAKMGLGKYADFIVTSLYLKKERSYAPWKVFLDSHVFITSKIRRSRLYHTWKKYLIQLMEPVYKDLGWREDYDDYQIKKLRKEILHLMCYYGYDDCVQKAKILMANWMKRMSNLNTIPPNFRPVVYCTAVRNGSTDVWNFVHRKSFEKNLATTEVNNLVGALGCARDPLTQQRFIKLSLSSDEAFSRYLVGFQLYTKTPYGRDNVFAVLKNLQCTKMGISQHNIMMIFLSFSDTMTTPEELNEVKLFYGRCKDHWSGSTKSKFRSIFQTITQNIEWTKANFHNIFMTIRRHMMKIKGL